MWSEILDYRVQPRTGLCRSEHHLLRRACSHRPEFAQGSAYPAGPKLAPSCSLNRATPSRHRSRQLQLLEPPPSRRQREGAIQPASRIDSDKRCHLETLADQSADSSCSVSRSAESTSIRRIEPLPASSLISWIFLSGDTTTTLYTRKPSSFCSSALEMVPLCAFDAMVVACWRVIFAKLE